MAKGYRPVRRDQPFLLPPDMRDWLPDDHPVWLVIAVVSEYLDTSAFHAGRKTGGAGTAGYDPDMLVTVLAWAYAHRVTSSREIEERCRTDVAFRVICGGNLPDHVTVARFRAEFGAAAGEFFAQVLALCARLGMGRLGTVALDGMKIAASASASANRAGEALRELAAGLVAAHAAADAAEDGAFGPGRRGDEVPAGVASPRSRAAQAERAERIGRALAGLEAERQAARDARDAQARAYLEAAAAGTPPRGSRVAEADVAAAQMNLERLTRRQQAKVDDYQRRNAAKIAAAGAGLAERPPVPPGEHNQVRRAAARLDNALRRAAAREGAAAGRQHRRGGPGPVRNITDPDSRLMPARGGFIQGYNAQNVTSEDGLIIATALTQDTADVTWFEPMTEAAGRAAALIEAHRPREGGPGGAEPRSDGPGIGLVLADAGYLSEANLTCPGPDRLIAVGKRRALEKAARGGDPAGDEAATGQATIAMAARLKTEAGITAYRRRGHIAETPHGHIKHNMAFRQLSMRGKAKATAEWQFACTVHNLLKAITSRHLTGQALTTLAT